MHSFLVVGELDSNLLYTNLVGSVAKVTREMARLAGAARHSLWHISNAQTHKICFLTPQQLWRHIRQLHSITWQLPKATSMHRWRRAPKAPSPSFTTSSNRTTGRNRAQIRAAHGSHASEPNPHPRRIHRSWTKVCS